MPIASSSWARLGAPSAVLSRGGVALLGLVCVVVTCPKSYCYSHRDPSLHCATAQGAAVGGEPWVCSRLSSGVLFEITFLEKIEIKKKLTTKQQKKKKKKKKLKTKQKKKKKKANFMNQLGSQ